MNSYRCPFCKFTSVELYRHLMKEHKKSELASYIQDFRNRLWELEQIETSVKCFRL